MGRDPISPNIPFSLQSLFFFKNYHQLVHVISTGGRAERVYYQGATSPAKSTKPVNLSQREMPLLLMSATIAGFPAMKGTEYPWHIAMCRGYGYYSKWTVQTLTISTCLHPTGQPGCGETGIWKRTQMVLLKAIHAKPFQTCLLPSSSHDKQTSFQEVFSHGNPWLLMDWLPSSLKGDLMLHNTCCVQHNGTILDNVAQTLNLVTPSSPFCTLVFAFSLIHWM